MLKCLKNRKPIFWQLFMREIGKAAMESKKIYAAVEAPCCDEKEVHEDKVRFVNENMPSEDEL